QVDRRRRNPELPYPVTPAFSLVNVALSGVAILATLAWAFESTGIYAFASMEEPDRWVLDYILENAKLFVVFVCVKQALVTIAVIAIGLDVIVAMLCERKAGWPALCGVVAITCLSGLSLIPYSLNYPIAGVENLAEREAFMNRNMNGEFDPNAGPFEY